MMRKILTTSALTGVFCAIFAGGVDAVTDALNMWQVMILGGISGATGSLIAQYVTRRQGAE